MRPGREIVERPLVLVAASPGGASSIASALGPQIHCVLANDYEDALKQLRERSVQMVVVGYYFDNAMPYRFISEVRSFAAELPVILVRALNLPLGEARESHIRAAYQRLGVDDFFDFYVEGAPEEGEARRRLFRLAVLERLRQVQR